MLFPFLVASIASAQNIAIQNSGFETATLPTNLGTGPFCNLIPGSVIYPTGGSVANWTAATTTANAAVGAVAPTLGGTNWTSKWWVGNDIGYIVVSQGTASLSQTLSTTLQNNTTYTLSMLVGRPTDSPGFNYALQLWAGSTLLSAASNLSGLAINSSGTESLTYSSGANNPQAGQPLQVVVTSNVEVFFDNLTLTAATGTTVAAVISASAFGAFSSAAPGSWIEIYGGNLAGDTRSWSGTDFNGINAPTSLDSVKVTVGGKAAFIDYISPGQVNALIPSDTPTGAQQLAVTGPGGVSASYPITINPAQPGLRAPLNFKIGTMQYAVAIFPDGAFALPAGAIPGVNSRPAKAGDTVTLYGVGFGSVSPSSPAGQLVQQLNTLTLALLVNIGGVPATVAYDGLAPNYTGLYQINVTIPPLPDGEAALTFLLSEGQQGRKHSFCRSVTEWS